LRVREGYTQHPDKIEERDVPGVWSMIALAHVFAMRTIRFVGPRHQVNSSVINPHGHVFDCETNEVIREIGDSLLIAIVAQRLLSIIDLLNLSVAAQTK